MGDRAQRAAMVIEEQCLRAALGLSQADTRPGTSVIPGITDVRVPCIVLVNGYQPITGKALIDTIMSVTAACRAQGVAWAAAYIDPCAGPVFDGNNEELKAHIRPWVADKAH